VQPGPYIETRGTELSFTSSCPTKVSWIFWDWCFALTLVVFVPLLYFPYALHNLPVASNVDERASLAILNHFHEGGLDPHFLMYPTLYYYLTYFLAWICPFAKILFCGRLINLSFVGLAAAVTYSFCRRHLDSRAVGAVAALSIVTSTIITDSGAYLCTDALLAATTLGSLYYLVEFFHFKGRREWLMAMVLLGCAVGCKYTAFLLYVAYYITEVLLRMWNRGVESKESHEKGSLLTAKVPRGLLIGVLLGLALTALMVVYAFPTTAAVDFIANNRTNADLNPKSEYLSFFHHMRVVLGEMAIASIILAAVVGRFKMIYEWIAPRRLYYGLGIVASVFLLSTPYSLLTPKRFLYDVGAVARSNVIVLSGQAQWLNYLSWLIHGDNLILLLLSAAGIVIVALRKNSYLFIVAIYVLVYSYVIGSAHIGYARYLTPLLPIIYCAAGAALVTLWKQKSPAFTRWARGLAIALIAAVSIQVATKIIVAREQSRSTDACLQSYRIIKQFTPAQVLYAGDAPSVELHIAGFQTKQVSWAQLRQGPLHAQLTCNEILVFDQTHAIENQVSFRGDATATTLLDDPRGHGQKVLKRSDCD
jgi:Dolichyl-phosphate-mannose-protein mannosyltransferase